jgi:hypothetical protein
MTPTPPNGAPVGVVQIEVIDMAKRVVNLPVMTPQGQTAMPVPFAHWFGLTQQLLAKLAQAEQQTAQSEAKKILTVGAMPALPPLPGPFGAKR